MSPSKLTTREAKNKILAECSGFDRDNALVAETRDGGYVILLPNRVVEIYESAGMVDAKYISLSGHWDYYDL